MINTDSLTSHYVGIWNNCVTSFPSLPVSYSKEDQKANESSFEKIIQELKLKGQKSNLNGKKHVVSGVSSTSLFRKLFVSVFDFEQAHLDLILSTEFKQVTKDFIKKAREFDKEISLQDIFQACRNAWIMCGIQQMIGEKVQLTPSLFAYSMLYPYSDNYLDDPAFSKEQKMGFSKRFHGRLMGIPTKPQNAHEVIIFKLIEMIEGQYSRKAYPGVYQSLLAIHNAQTKSLALVDRNVTITDGEILRICIEKGGTSVLADGYLVAGNLTNEQQISLFGYGTYLQFIDDIQDLNEDTKAGQVTVFCKEAKQSKLDYLTNKVFSLGQEVIQSMYCFNGSDIVEFKSLINKSINSMLVETILLNDPYYSKDYIKSLEVFSPLSIEYLRKRRSKLSPQRISYIHKIVESTISSY